MAAVMASLFDFFVASGALLIFLLIMRIGWSVISFGLRCCSLRWLLLAAGIGMVVSAASLFFRDVKYIVEVF